MSEVTSIVEIFKNEEFGEIRTIQENGRVLFCGRDIALALGYSNTKDALARHCKEDGVAFHDLIDNIGREQQAKFITEGNVYRLIVHSKLPSAEKFEKWVFDEVLPSIRKHGLYAADELLADPDLFISALQELKAERAKVKALTAENSEKGKVIAIQNQQITEMKPKETYYDVVLNCPDVVTISVVAKDYGWSARRMNEFLHEQGIQFKQSDVWLLYQKYAEYGYTCTKTISYDDNGVTHVRPHTYWTQKGRLFLYDVLKNNGVLPMVERN